MIHPGPVRHHITRNSQAERICDQQPAREEDLPVMDLQGLREVRAEATLCPQCQVKSGIPEFALRPQLYSQKAPRTLAQLYTVPVLYDFDRIRNCPHCRLKPRDRGCRAWEQVRGSIQTLGREARRTTRNVDDMTESTGGRPATLHQFKDGSVGYLATNAPAWQEAGEITGKNLRKALRTLEGNATQPS